MNTNGNGTDMSSEERVDPQLIEQTKRQIRMQVNEIAQLTKSDMSPGEFYAEFLPRLVSSLAAIGGVVWTLSDNGQLTVAYQVNYQESGLARKSREEQIQHLLLLHHMVKKGEGGLIPPHAGFGNDADGGTSSDSLKEGDEAVAANPTDCLLVLGPLKTELEDVGIVEIFQRADAGASTQKGYLRFLLQMCDLAGDFLRTRQLRNFSDRQTLWTRLEEFSRLIHASLDPRETAYIVANEGRRLIECDRVSIALRRGNRCVIEAVSGQDMVDRRSNTVRMLGDLATVVVNAGEPVWYHGDTKDLAPQIEEKLQEYVDESHTKAVAVLPLQRTLPPPDPEKERLNEDEIPVPFGAIIVEQIEDSRIPMTMVQRIDVVRGHSVAAIANAMEHSSLFLMPLWRTLGKSKVLTTARYLPKTLLVVSAVLAVLSVLIFVPKDFRLHSTGQLKPEVRQDVFAGIDGNVDTVVVQHGQHVDRGQLLLTLNNYELGGQTEKIRGEHDSIVRQIEGLQNQLTLRRTADEQMEIHNQIHELTARREALAKEYQVLVQEWELLQVRSPIEGEVMTWDVGNKLKAR
ncbi:MAG: biotin/lipoyl-binding protein, partial [Planctomycetia bacterium]|nr:biotin/lipoyl-binding protein [Planctomycetia bacterium]